MAKNVQLVVQTAHLVIVKLMGNVLFKITH